jgi:hypothetical protein
MALVFGQGVLLEEELSGFAPLLGLKADHECDVISVVAEFMVDVARVEAWPCV